MTALITNISVPEVTCIVTFGGNFEFLRLTLAHLRVQTIYNMMEVILIKPQSIEVDVQTLKLDHFRWFEVIDMPDESTRTERVIRGISAAHAPIIAPVEDHTFADPGWMAAILDVYRVGDWAAVGPLMLNANPHTLVSWVNFLLSFSTWGEGERGASIEFLPGHNTSYRRAVLLTYGDTLTTMMQSERVFHWDLRAKGYTLYFEPRAVIHHINISQGRAFIDMTFQSSRAFAALRAKGWSFGKRVVYTVGSPLIPFVRLYRLIPQIPASLKRDLVFRMRLLAVLLFGLFVSALGEMMGYLSGGAADVHDLEPYEVRRMDYVRAADRAVLRRMGDS